MLKHNFLFGLEKLCEYWASAVKVESFNSFVGPLPKIKIYFPYYQCAHTNSYQLQKKWHFHPRCPQVMKFLNVNWIQYHNRYVRIYLDEHF